MHLAGGAGDGVHLAGLLEQCADRLAVLDIRLQIAALAADLDDLMTALQRGDNGLAHGSGGADDDDFHGVLLGMMRGEGAIVGRMRSMSRRRRATPGICRGEFETRPYR